jgi:hypothetical protein
MPSRAELSQSRAEPSRFHVAHVIRVRCDSSAMRFDVRRSSMSNVWIFILIRFDARTGVLFFVSRHPSATVTVASDGRRTATAAPSSAVGVGEGEEDAGGR